MKIGALRTHYAGPNGTTKLSAVDAWRLDNPLSHLTNHEVTFYNKIVENGEEPEIAWEKFQGYDLVWSSYFSNPKAYASLRAASEAFGFKVVMDVDDNMYEVDPMAPAYIRYHPGSKDLQTITRIFQDVDYLSASTPYLASVIGRYRKKPIMVLPNLIDPKKYIYDPGKVPNNGDKIIIGYQGSATHYADLVDTGTLYALRRIVNKYPNVEINIMGCIIDDFLKYIPKGRIRFTSGAPDYRKWQELWQSLDFDIGLAPLKQGGFNRSKSNIKYQEYGLRKIPGLYSFIDPYLSAVKDNETGFIFQDEEELFEKLTWLIENPKLRKVMGDKARTDVLKNWTMKKGTNPWQSFLDSL